jgi:hypothetical protein
MEYQIEVPVVALIEPNMPEPDYFMGLRPHESVHNISSLAPSI